MPTTRKVASLPTLSAGRVQLRQSGLFRGAIRLNATAAAVQEPVQPRSPPAPPLSSLDSRLQQKQQAQGPEKSRQLDIRARAYESAFYATLAKVMEFRKRYVRDRFIFVPHDEMETLLRGFGATDADFEALQLVSDNLYSDPTLPFRKSRNCRFCLDFDTASIRRLEFQPFALSKEEDFRRYDSDTVRHFDEIQDEMQLNAAFQGLLLFKALVVNGVESKPRPKLDYSGNKWVSTAFNVRTVTNRDILGEPALEGVHTDGVDHTMTTYLGARNMTSDSAVTMLHDYAETTGIPFQDTSPRYICGRVQHKKFLDTLVVVDAEYKHSLSPVYAVDETKDATRDMLVLFTRRPVMGDHISAGIDSLKPHPTLPMEVDMFVPSR